jgi:hypothetical protein
MWSCCYMGTGKQLGLCYLWLWIPVNIKSLSFVRYKPRCFGYSILLDCIVPQGCSITLTILLTFMSAFYIFIFWKCCWMNLWCMPSILLFCVMITQVRNSTTILTKEFIDSLPNGWEEYAWRRINKGIQL